MIRRAVAAALVSALLSLVASPWLACGGWQPSAAARHSCCTTVGHACPQAHDADACCAQKESGSTSSQAAHAQVDGTVAIVPSGLWGLLQTRLTDQTHGPAFRSGSVTPHIEAALYLRYSLLRV